MKKPAPPELLTLHDMRRIFPDDAAAVEFIARARWGDHMQCVKCGSYKIGAQRADRRFQCWACMHSFAVLTGTPLQGTKIELCKLLLLARLLASPNPLNGPSVSFLLKIEIKTAQRLLRGMRQLQADDPAFLARLAAFN